MYVTFLSVRSIFQRGQTGRDAGRGRWMESLQQIVLPIIKASGLTQSIEKVQVICASFSTVSWDRQGWRELHPAPGKMQRKPQWEYPFCCLFFYWTACAVGSLCRSTAMTKISNWWRKLSKLWINRVFECFFFVWMYDCYESVIIKSYHTEDTCV